MGRLPALIVDPERRSALQFAFLQRFPKVRMPCCGYQHCFRCKLQGWHDGSCEEMQRKEMCQEIKFCPSCRVPTIKSDGCDSIACVCGREWDWGYAEHPLCTAFRDKNKDFIEEHLDQWGVSSQITSAGYTDVPVNFFMSMIEGSAVDKEIMLIFARLGARGCEQKFLLSLCSAIHAANKQLV